MNIPPSFGQWLRIRRRQLDLTQVELARRVGCAQVTIKKLEAGQLKPSSSMAVSLINQLDVPAHERDTLIKFARGGPAPALSSHLLPKNNLPAKLTSFIGREKELVEVKRLLTISRLVTLSGDGGVGKTRLSIQVGMELLSQFPDGVWLVEFAAITNPDLLPAVILSMFKLNDQPNKTTLESLQDYLQDKQALLILDNCEHVIDSAAKVALALLENSPRLEILATSREALDVMGEIAWRVPSLSLPDITKLPETAGQLTQYESVRLFIERAALVSSTFVVNKENAPAIAQVCFHLDGIPLALELAAARIRTMSVEQINDHLDDRFRLLTGGNRTALPRHQTLRALIDWSYNLLSDAERKIFARLSVFAGGWTSASAQAVCSGNGIEPNDVLEIISQLVNKSLAVMEPGQDDEARYGMLETIRQYAQDILMISDEMKQFHERHLAYYLDFVESAELELRGRKQVVWMSRLDMEHANIRAALSWSLESQPEFGLRMAAALVEFWDMRGHITEARKWLEAMLNATSHLSATPSRVKAIFGAGFMAMRQSEFAENQLRLEEGIALAQAIGYKQGIAKGYSHQGDLKNNDNDLEQAEGLHNQALEIWRQLGDKLGIGQALGPLAECALNRHDYARAESLFNESLALFREVGNERAAAGALWDLSEVAIYRRDYESARVSAKESLALYRELDDKHGIATALRALSVAVQNQGDHVQARTTSEQSVGIFREIGDRNCMGLTLSVLASQLYARNDLQRAAELIRQSLTIQREMGDKDSESSSLNILGRIALAQGNPSEAQIHFCDGLILQRDSKDARMLPALLEGLANNFAAYSRAHDAIRLLGAAEALRDEINLALMQIERPEYDSLVCMLHEQVVDDVMFQKIRAEGRAMTIDQAIAYALEKEND